MNNVVSLVGRLTKDVELCLVDEQRSLVNITLAVRSNFKQADGNYHTDFVVCTAWNKRAETLAQYGKKGMLIGIKGRLQSRVYTNKYHQQSYSLNVCIEEFYFLEKIGTNSKQQQEEKQEEIQQKTSTVSSNLIYDEYPQSSPAYPKEVDEAQPSFTILNVDDIPF